MYKKVNLIEHLPLFIVEFKEIQSIMNSENPEFDFLINECQKLQNNQFISSCNLDGIKKFEKLLKITSSDEDSLESRISRVLTRWNDMDPYTWRKFLEKLSLLCDDDFEVVEKWQNYQLDIITHLDSFGQVEEFENIVDSILPANIQVNVNNELNYNLENNMNIFSYVDTVFEIVIT